MKISHYAGIDSEPFVIDCAGKNLVLDRPLVMGILNLNAQSYCPVSRYSDLDQAIARGVEMVAQGADLLDIGAEPTNPKVKPDVSTESQLQLLEPVVKELAKAVDVPISIDTSDPKVMMRMAELGAGMINDVRALTEPGALQAAAETGLPVCLMHMRYPHGLPTIPEPVPENYFQHIHNFLQAQVMRCVEAGIPREKLIIDPGVGGGSFGKRPQDDLEIIRRLNEFADLQLPILISTTRKSFIGNLLNQAVEQRLPASLATVVLTAINGAHIIRVHDVAETVSALAITHLVLCGQHD